MVITETLFVTDLLMDRQMVQFLICPLKSLLGHKKANRALGGIST